MEIDLNPINKFRHFLATTEPRMLFFLGIIIGVIIGAFCGAWLMHDWMFFNSYDGCVSCYLTSSII